MFWHVSGRRFPNTKKDPGQLAGVSPVRIRDQLFGISVDPNSDLVVVVVERLFTEDVTKRNTITRVDQVEDGCAVGLNSVVHVVRDR